MTGLLRLGVIPAAMPSVSFLTARFCAAHPAATVEVQSLNSRSIQRGLDAFEIDAGLTYLENEPLENVRRAPLYRERYVLVTHHANGLAKRKTITWAEAAQERLCLLSEDMQNRRIINNVFESWDWRSSRRWSAIPISACAPICGTAALPVLFRTHCLMCSPVHAIWWNSILSSRSTASSSDLFLTDRDPVPPMANALIAALRGADAAGDLAAVPRGKI